MATSNLYMLPLTVLVQYLTNVGVIAAGATLTTQVAGSVSTLQTTYTDSTGLVPNANPLTLNSSGRAAGQSGALTAFWVPSGTAVDVYFTDTLGETWSIKNMAAINDPSSSGSLQALLANPANANAAGVGPVAGVDLVANAIKSYDVFATVRAANAPVLASGQTLSIEIQGGLAINDGLGGNFYWSATSTAADDGATVLKPATATTGRWLRLNLPPLAPVALTISTDQSVSSSTALTTVPGLSAVLASGGTYLVQLRLQLLGVTATTTGYKVQATFGGVINGVATGGGVMSGNLSATAVVGGFGSVLAQTANSITTPDFVSIDYVVPVTTAGSVTVQFAQDASSANLTTIKAGSQMIITRIK